MEDMDLKQIALSSVLLLSSLDTDARLKISGWVVYESVVKKRGNTMPRIPFQKKANFIQHLYIADEENGGEKKAATVTEYDTFEGVFQFFRRDCDANKTTIPIAAFDPRIKRLYLDYNQNGNIDDIISDKYNSVIYSEKLPRITLICDEIRKDIVDAY